MKMKLAPLSLAAILAMSGVIAVACDDSSSSVKENPDGGPTNPPPPPQGPQPNDGGLPDAFLPDGAPADCYTNPTTHFEIINACTNAVKVVKNPTLPLLYPDGGLPPTQ
jgi:hypothetical protein